MDAVADRDFVADFVYAAAMTMVHVSRLAEELILWSSAEFGFIRLPDAFATGSSIMPQKKNAGRRRARARAQRPRDRRARVDPDDDEGTAADLQPRPAGGQAALFDAEDALLPTLDVLAEMLPRIEIDEERMAAAAVANYSLATDYADYLAQQGLPFREAHEAVGKLVRYAEGKKKELHELSLAELQRFSPLFAKDALKIDAMSARERARRARAARRRSGCALSCGERGRRIDGYIARAEEGRVPIQRGCAGAEEEDMTEVKLAPSILTADFGHLADQIRAAEEGGADYIHLDVMDGHFVPPITFGPIVVEMVRKVTKLPLDMHLMIERPEAQFDAFAEAGADIINFHIEATDHADRLLRTIQQMKKRAGICINPGDAADRHRARARRRGPDHGDGDQPRLGRAEDDPVDARQGARDCDRCWTRAGSRRTSRSTAA